ncbi:unnamed protein product [Acidocella sp. C78]|nr:unnamed protein product [Acidocella sp. C78]
MGQISVEKSGLPGSDLSGNQQRGATQRASTALRDRFAAGQRAAWSATGGSGGDAAGASQPAAAPSGAPAWAQRLRRQAVSRAAQNIIHEGEGRGGGMRPNLRGDGT